MRITQRTGRMFSMVMLSGLLATTGAAFGADDQVLAGPKSDAPTTQPDKDHHRGFSGDHKPGDRRGPGGPGGPGMEVKRVLDGLNLTEDQKTKVHEIMDPLKAEMDKWRDAHKDELQKIREDGKAARESGDKDKMKANREKAEAIFKTMPNPKPYFEKVRAVLTDEQRTKFDEGMKAMRERREQMMKNMRDGKGPGGPDGKGPDDGPRRHPRNGDGDSKPTEGLKPPVPAPAD